MNALCLQHVFFEGPGYVRDILGAHGIVLRELRLFEGERLPDPGGVDFLVVMGGPMGVHDHDLYPWLTAEKRFIEQAVKRGTPVVGICLGAQLIADVMGAPVKKNPYREIGWFPVRRVDAGMGESPVTVSLPGHFYALHWHGDTFGIPEGAYRFAESEACENQAFIYGKRVAALQFHLEATPQSVRQLLNNAGGDLDGSEFVQDREQILAMDHLRESNVLMERIMGALLTAAVL